MLRNILPWRKKRYTLYLARRGEPLVIESFAAKNDREAREKARNIIEDLDPEAIPDLQKYRSFRLCPEGVESFADCERLRNPYFRAEEKEERVSAKDLEEIALASVAQNIPKIVGNILDMGLSLQSQVFQRIMQTYMSMLLPGGGSGEEKPIDKLIKLGEQLIQLWQAQNQAQAQPRKRPRILPREG